MTNAVLQTAQTTADLSEIRSGVVAVGNFDGMHRGHQAVLACAGAVAADDGMPTVLLTFAPHPRTVFDPSRPVFLLTPDPAKRRLARVLGIDAVVTLTFDLELSRMAAETFVSDILVDGLAARHVVTGFDFHFGRDRQGSPVFLRAEGDRHGFGVSIVEEFGDEKGAVSSSRIRAALEQGDLVTAEELLGYRWFVEGVVLHGDKRGRELGYPTANLALSEDCRLKHGIYAVRVWLDGRVIDGVASFGRRPTFDHGRELLETFLFDFDDDLYGREIMVQLVAYLRPELRFDSAEALVGQMEKDAVEARNRLAAAGPGSALDQRLMPLKSGT